MPHTSAPSQSILGIWDRVLQLLARDQQAVTMVAALTACRLNADNPELLHIAVPDRNDCQELLFDSEAKASRIASCLEQVLGYPISVRIAPEPGSSNRGRYRHAENDPTVQQILALFDAEILAFEPMSESEWEIHLNRLTGIEPGPTSGPAQG